MNKGLKRAVIKTLIYSDIFDYPLTVDELGRFLIGYRSSNLEHEFKRISSASAKFSELASVIKNEFKLIEKSGEFVFLKGKKNLIEKRIRRNKASERKLKRVRLVTKVLKPVPWIKMMAVTGDVAAGNADKKSDIDMLLVADSKRIWLSRALSLLFLQIFGQRVNAKAKRFKNRVCLNMFIPDNGLEQAHDLFVANEIARMKVLWRKDNMYQRFLLANSWVEKFLPNWWEKALGESGGFVRLLANLSSSSLRSDLLRRRKPAERATALSASCAHEPPFVARQENLISPLFNKLEQIARKLQLKRFPAGIKPETLLMGHPINHKKEILEEYRKRLEEFRIEQL